MPNDVHSFFIEEKKTHKNNIEMIAFTFIALNAAIVGVVFEQHSFMEIAFLCNEKLIASLWMLQLK